MLNLSLSFFFAYCIVAVISPYLQVMIHNLGYSYEVVGALLSLYEIAAIFGPMLVALWIDRSGRMKSSVLVCTVISNGRDGPPDDEQLHHHGDRSLDALRLDLSLHHAGDGQLYEQPL